jgi:hypothetical protein
VNLLNPNPLVDDDHAYSSDWEEGKQYWFDIVHDSARDRRDPSRQIRMIDNGISADKSERPVYVMAAHVKDDQIPFHWDGTGLIKS